MGAFSKLGLPAQGLKVGQVEAKLESLQKWAVIGLWRFLGIVSRSLWV